VPRLRSGLILAGMLGAAVVAPPASRAFDARSVEPSIYKIYTFIPQKDGQFAISSGSGFLVSGRRYVVTNFHVVEGGAQFFIAYRDGREAKLIEAKRADSRPNVDLALLETREDLPGEALRLGEYEPEKLAEVVAIGYPGAANLNKDLVPGPDARGVPLTDLDSTVTTGVVSRMTYTNLKISETQILSARTVQHNSAINPGNSGGPLFDACGLVVGVNTLQGLNSQGLFFSIHANEVGRFLREGQIAYSSTTRGCTGGMSSGIVPLALGLTATLALAALMVMIRTQRGPAFLQALPKAFSRITLPMMGGQKKGRGQKLLPFRGAISAPVGGVLTLRPAGGGPTVQLDESGASITIGRGPGADVVIASDTVSKVHARLSYDRRAQRIRITDLGSSNGTFLNGARITNGEAAKGAKLRFGTVEFAVARVARDDIPIATAAGPGGWMLSGFDPSGRALQFELRPETDASGHDLPATWSLGRDPARVNFVIDDISVSSLHAQFQYSPGAPLQLRDMGSMNGTRVDGDPIGKRTVTLRDTGQELGFGMATLRLSRLTG
jgi:S1-C subfamily serine protease/pSer/pThr/pTyr-binding forkhead associated (FHA) protein